MTASLHGCGVHIMWCTLDSLCTKREVLLLAAVLLPAKQSQALFSDAMGRVVLAKLVDQLVRSFKHVTPMLH